MRVSLITSFIDFERWAVGGPVQSHHHFFVGYGRQDRLLETVTLTLDERYPVIFDRACCLFC